MFIDSHAHVNFIGFKNDTEQVLKDSIKQSTWVVNVGSQYETSRRAVKIAEEFEEGVYAVIGLHPVHLFAQVIDEEEVNFHSREENFDFEKYKELAKSPKVVGIGECGLEFFEIPDITRELVRTKEIEVFLQQIKLACEVEKTLVVHSRDAYEDVYDILANLKEKPLRIVIHSFIGSPEQAKKFLNIGCYFSLNGIITYKPAKEKKPGRSDPGLHEAVKKIPLERIMLETDCPYLSPEPVRGTRNIPVNVKYIARKIAELKGVGLSEVEEQTTKNARAVFKI